MNKNMNMDTGMDMDIEMDMDMGMDWPQTLAWTQTRTPMDTVVYTDIDKITCSPTSYVYPMAL